MNAVNVRLFAGLSDRLGGREIAVDLKDGATGADLLDHLAAAHPDAAGILRSCRVAVDREFADLAAAIPVEAEIALIPPVSGG